MQYTADSAKTCFSRYPLFLKLLVMVVTWARSAPLPGARKHTVLNTFSTWQRAKGWALYIALVTFPYYWDTMPARCADRRAMARAVLATG